MADIRSTFAAVGLNGSGALERWRSWLPWIGLGLVMLALCVGWALFPLRAWMEGLQSWLLGKGIAGVAIFVLALFVATFLPAPDWPLPIVAGYVYGFWALPLTYVTIALASTAAFLAARHLARDTIKTVLARHPKYRTVDKVVANDGWQMVVLLRLSPIVPFNLQNYALGVTAIPFWQYLCATLVGTIPGVVIYVYFGVFGKGLGQSVGTLDWALVGLGTLATIAFAVVVGSKIKAKLGDK